MPSITQAQNFHIDTLFDFDHMLAYIVAGLMIAIFVLLFYNRLYVYRENDINNETRNQNVRLATIMRTGNLSLWTYDTETRHYKILSETGDYSKEYNPIDFALFYDRNDFETLRSAIFDIFENRRLTSTVSIRSNASEEPIHYYDIHISITERDQHGRVKNILGVQHDVTEEHNKQALTNELLMRYHTVFNSSLIDMLYYDKNGILTDINDTACMSFNIHNRQALLDGKYHISENPFFANLDLQGVDYIQATAIYDFANSKEERLKPLKLNEKIFYEASINTNHNENGELEGIYVAGRNVTEMVESFHQQQEGAIRLKKATQHIQEYIDNIDYALRISNVRLVNYYPQSYTLEISDNIRKSQLRMSQLRCIRLASPRYRRAVSSILNRMDHLTHQSIEQTIETEIRDEKKRQISLMFNFVPITDKNGQIEHYFGMCRNMTDLVETERRLAIETQKAREAELLKESFLTNMSYEIRTPLSTVLGFADLFETEHDEEDEPVFVEEIKKNTNTLLQLINDILFLSRLDADMVEFKNEEFDLAEIFDAYCQMGWSSIRPEVKVTVENPFEHLIINGDSEQLGRVIQKLCAIASDHTPQGMIRAKYEYRRNELVISIEDTGEGIDPETVPKVFERFVRNKEEKLCGTGLDLPIVESLVHKMGGSIELQSDLGKGTVVWIFLPCQAKGIEKKRDIIA